MSENRHTALLILEGHIIDSLMLPSIMDMVMDEGGNFTVEELRVGQHKTDTSYCRIQVAASTPEKLDRIVRKAKELGEAAADDHPVQLEEIPKDGVYPDNFYSTNNLTTLVLLPSRTWATVERQEMDTAIAVSPAATAGRMRPKMIGSGSLSTKRSSPVRTRTLTRMLVPKPKNALQSPGTHSLGFMTDMIRSP